MFMPILRYSAISPSISKPVRAAEIVKLLMHDSPSKVFASGFAEAVPTPVVATTSSNGIKFNDPESDFEDLDDDEEKNSAEQVNASI